MRGGKTGPPVARVACLRTEPPEFFIRGVFAVMEYPGGSGLGRRTAVTMGVAYASYRSRTIPSNSTEQQQYAQRPIMTQTWLHIVERRTLTTGKHTILGKAAAEEATPPALRALALGRVGGSQWNWGYGLCVGPRNTPNPPSAWRHSSFLHHHHWSNLPRTLSPAIVVHCTPHRI